MMKLLVQFRVYFSLMLETTITCAVQCLPHLISSLHIQGDDDLFISLFSTTQQIRSFFITLPSCKDYITISNQHKIDEDVMSNETYVNSLAAKGRQLETRTYKRNHHWCVFLRTYHWQLAPLQSAMINIVFLGVNLYPEI